MIIFYRYSRYRKTIIALYYMMNFSELLSFPARQLSGLWDSILIFFSFMDIRSNINEKQMSIHIRVGVFFLVFFFINIPFLVLVFKVFLWHLVWIQMFFFARKLFRFWQVTSWHRKRIWATSLAKSWAPVEHRNYKGNSYLS